MSTSPPPLVGQVALVTGAGRGLGREMARHLAEAGAAVACLARNASELDETRRLLADAVSTGEPDALAARILTLACDVTDADAVERAVAEVERTLGPITLLVNNAGHGGEPTPLWLADPARWWRTFEVNVYGAFLCLRAVLARMVARGGGRIVNVTSRAGNVAIPNATAYATSKAALTRLSETAALEAAPHGVRVFAVEPGTVRTRMTEALLEGDAGRTWLPWYRRTFDAGEDARPDEVARLVVRLARGDGDALSGRFLSRADDLDALVADAAGIAAEERRVLRLRP
jgi:NAD(P)-dependent dehydrogenase (short-subunit alcohol dehydrogenase family)